MTQCEPDREHEQRCDFVGHERVEGAVADLEVRERVGLLDANARPVGIEFFLMKPFEMRELEQIVNTLRERIGPR